MAHARQIELGLENPLHHRRPLGAGWRALHRLAAAGGRTWEERIERTMPAWKGAYSMVILANDRVLAVRDQIDRPDAAPPALGHDFRLDVERWLEEALRRRSVTASAEP